MSRIKTAEVDGVILRAIPPSVEFNFTRNIQIRRLRNQVLVSGWLAAFLRSLITKSRVRMCVSPSRGWPLIALICDSNASCTYFAVNRRQVRSLRLKRHSLTSPTCCLLSVFSSFLFPFWLHVARTAVPVAPISSIMSKLQTAGGKVELGIAILCLRGKNSPVRCQKKSVDELWRNGLRIC